MPYPNEHSMRIADPSKFIEGSMRSKDLGSGIRIIIGKLKGENSMSTQAIRFDKGKFTFEQAKEWIKSHGYKPISMEKATG